MACGFKTIYQLLYKIEKQYHTHYILKRLGIPESKNSHFGILNNYIDEAEQLFKAMMVKNRSCVTNQ